LPLLGDIRAVGLTPSQLKWEILKRLINYVKDESAVVTIAVTDPNSYRFTVSGNVEHPGVFTSHYYCTVTEALALAGGLNKFAAHRLTIMRPDASGHIRQVPIDYERVASGDHPDENIALITGDVILVP
jgi:polysaccharide export outer membrane protein